MDDLERALPSQITDLAVRCGSELTLPLREAKWAVRIASENSIAVLGVEVFRILDAGLGVETYSGYEFQFDGLWRDFVGLNNESALRFMDENSFGEDHGYILTATSEMEFGELSRRV